MSNTVTQFFSLANRKRQNKTDMQSRAVSFIALLICLLSSFIKCEAQIDTEFWFAAPSVCVGHANRPIVLRISSYDSKATVTIAQPANPAFQTITVSLNAYQAQTVDLTSQIANIENAPPDVVLNRGLHITSTAPIAVYYEVEGRSAGNPANKSVNPELFVLKGRICKGRSFLIPAQNRFNNAEANTSTGAYSPQPKNGFIIVATENNTTVTIKLSKPGVNRVANIPFTIVLNKGESFAVNSVDFDAAGHLIGSEVKADKPICITIYDDSVGPAPPAPANRDLIGDQILPEEKLGNEFIIIRGDLTFTGSVDQDYYYIIATQNNTEIKLNGTTITTINRGDYYEGVLTENSAFIQTSSPAYVYQVTGNAGEMTSTNLPNIRCTGSNLVSFVRSTPEDFQLNILCKSTQVNSFLLNGIPNIIQSNFFEDVPGTNGVWKAARINTLNLPNINALIPSRVNSVISNTVGLFHLGFLNGNANSGSRLGYFSNYEIANLIPASDASICIGNDLGLKASLIQDASYSWTGPDNFSSNQTDILLKNTSFKNGGTYYLYTKVLGCGDFYDSIKVVVNPLPTAKFVKVDTVCKFTSLDKEIAFTGTSPWSINYFNGKGYTDVGNIGVSPFSFSLTGINTITLKINKVTDGNGCTLSNADGTPIDTSVLTVLALPTLKINNTDIAECAHRASQINMQLTGVSPFNMQYNKNGTALSDTSIKLNNYSLPVTVGKQNELYVFTRLEDANHCPVTLNDTVKITVNPTPLASFIVPSGICKNDTLFANANTAGITNWQWLLNKQIFSTNSNLVLPAAGNGDSVSIGLVTQNASGCKSDTLTRKMVLWKLPIAAFNIPDTLCVANNVQLKDVSSSSEGNITKWLWQLNGNAPFDTVNNGIRNYNFSGTGTNSLTLKVLSSLGCVSLPFTQVFDINPLPIAGFKLPEICLNDAQATFTDTSFMPGNAPNQLPFKYQWQFSGAATMPTPTTSTAANPTVLFNVAAAYTIQQTVISAKGCQATSTQNFVVNGAKPTANFTVNSNAFCSNLPFTVTNKSSVDFGRLSKLEVYWDWANNAQTKTSDTLPVINQAYQYTYPVLQQAPYARQYQVRLVAISGSTCRDTATQLITTYAMPKVDFKSINAICKSAVDTISLTQASETTGITGIGAYVGNVIAANGKLNLPIDTGLYTISYQFTSNQNCKDSARQSFRILPAPKAQFSYLGVACTDTAITFNNLSTVDKPQQINQWIWNFANGNTSINEKPVAQFFSSSTKYPVQLKVTTDSGCTHIYTDTITIFSRPIVQFTVPSICLPNGTGTFISTSSVAGADVATLSHAWDFGDPVGVISGTLQQQSHTYKAVGNYPVTLSVTSLKGCKSSLTKMFNQIYNPPIASFTATDTAICINKSIAFNSTSTSPNGNITQTNWLIPTNQQYSTPAIRHQFIDSGNMPIRLAVTDTKGCTNSITKNVMVYPYPYLHFGQSSIRFLEGGIAYLRPQSPSYYYGNQLRFQWNPSTYLNNSNILVPIAQLPAGVDSMRYTLTLTGAGSCATADSIWVVKTRSIVIPNAFTPNGDGVNDRWFIDFIESYPASTVEVFNRYGQRVYYKQGYSNVAGWDGTYQGQPLPVATYYYLIDLQNGQPPFSGSITIVR